MAGSQEPEPAQCHRRCRLVWDLRWHFARASHRLVALNGVAAPAMDGSYALLLQQCAAPDTPGRCIVSGQLPPCAKRGVPATAGVYGGLGWRNPDGRTCPLASHVKWRCVAMGVGAR